jgi:tetratricopeptide (TPR) repeat protein
MLKKAALLFLILAGSSLFTQGQVAPPKKTPSPSTGQQVVLIQEGVSQHDRGNYDAAIKLYEEALALNPDNVEALYELSFSYSQKKDYKKSLEISYRGAEYKSDMLPNFYMQIGNNLDLLGESAKSVEVYKSGIKLLPEMVLLRYNLAVTYSKMNKNDEARSVLKEAIAIDPNHPGSHALLSAIWQAGGYRTPALLAACRYLVLDPRSERATAVLQIVKEATQAGVKRDTETNSITILMDSSAKKDEGDFGGIDLVLGLARAGSMNEKNKQKTEMQTLVGQFELLFGVLARNDRADRDKFTWKYYAPYFAELKQKNHVEPFVYYISQIDGNEETAKWLADNKNRVGDFLAWSKFYKWPPVN